MFVDAWVQRGRPAEWIEGAIDRLGLDGVTLFASTPSPSGGLPRALFSPSVLGGIFEGRARRPRLGWCEWLDTRTPAMEAMSVRLAALPWPLVGLLEFDVEEGARANQTDAALERLESVIKSARRDGFAGEVSVTLTPSARPHQLRFLELAQVVRPQWYVFRRPDAMGPHWSHALLSPGPQIERWARRFLPLVEPHQRLEAGLAGYWQEGVKGFEGRPLEALEVSASAAGRVTNHIVYWSADWLMGGDAAAQFVRALSGAPDDDAPIGEVERVRRIQWAMVALGADLGRSGVSRDGADGRWGPRSRESAMLWEARLGLPQDGAPDDGLLEGLEGALREAGIRDDFEGSALEARKRRTTA